MRDITSDMSFIVSMFITGFKNIFNIMSQIQFAGITLLQFVIACALISIFIPILLSIVNNSASSSKSEYEFSKRVERIKSAKKSRSRSNDDP